MALVLGLDLGTTTLTALAVDAASGEVVARSTLPNAAEVTAAADKARGRSEWDAQRLAVQAGACLKGVAERLGPRAAGLAGLGLTGQQHGAVLVGADLRPLSPFISWQDRRGDEPHPGGSRTSVEEARARVGEDAAARAGCRLAAGYMAVTLFWLREQGLLPAGATACFATDYLGATLTGRAPVTDPTSAASAGVLDVRRGDWDDATLAALGLPRSLFPPVRTSGERLGGLTEPWARATGLPAGLPVFVGVGDNQASFLGGVADPSDTALVNVGTGGQVSAFSDTFRSDPLLETRPFPRGGFLLVAAGLSGGAAYAALERFFRAVGRDVLGAEVGEGVYARMNELAAGVPRGAGGLRCEPFFFGTRAEPGLRGGWAQVSAENFTPGHLARALLEGMARTFASGYGRITRVLGRAPGRLAGAGNGLRANPVLARVLGEEFGRPLALPTHAEEAAFGAALLGAVGAGVLPDLAAAGALVRYTDIPRGG